MFRRERSDSVTPRETAGFARVAVRSGGPSTNAGPPREKCGKGVRRVRSFAAAMSTSAAAAMRTCHLRRPPCWRGVRAAR